MSKFELQSKLKLNIDSILCLLILNNGKIAAGSNDGSISIFNSNNFKTFLTIKEHKKGITSLTQTKKLKFTNIISSSKDYTIIIFELIKNTYKIVQVINNTNKCNKFIELKQSKNDFCYGLDNGELKLFSINKSNNAKDVNDNIINEEFIFNFNDSVFNIIETINNEIVVIFSFNNHYLKFIDIQNKKPKKTIQNISIIGNNSLCFFQNKYLIIGGSYMITVINIFNYSKEIIDTNSWKIYSIINCFNKDKYILYSDDDSNIYFCELNIGNSSDINLKEIYHYNLCSSSIFSMLLDKKNKKIILGENHSIINILNFIP